MAKNKKEVVPETVAQPSNDILNRKYQECEAIITKMLDEIEADFAEKGKRMGVQKIEKLRTALLKKQTIHNKLIELGRN